MSEESHIPRRYVTIRGKRATAEVWSSIPGRETEEVWLKGVRPVVKLSGRESEHMYNLIGKVHAALSEVGLRRRAQRFVMGRTTWAATRRYCAWPESSSSSSKGESWTAEGGGDIPAPLSLASLFGRRLSSEPSS